MHNMVGNNKKKTLIITAGINGNTEDVNTNTEVKIGIEHKKKMAATKTYNKFFSLSKRLLNLPPKKYPEAKPPKVIAITELHTYKLLPKNGANSLAPQISAAITEAPSTNEIV